MTNRAAAVRVPAQRVPGRAPVGGQRTRPSLSVVLPAPSRAARTPFVLCVAGLLLLGLIGLLLLNTVLAQGAFTVHELQKRTAALTDEQQRLETKVSLAGSPLVLAQKAKALGLVQVRDPAFIRTSDGRVLGHPQVAKRPPAAAPTTAAASGQSMPQGQAKPTQSKPTQSKPTPAKQPQPRRTP